MKIEVQVKEISYGIVTVEVDDAVADIDSSVIEKATDAYGEGEVYWTGGDFRIVDWEIIK